MKNIISVSRRTDIPAFNRQVSLTVSATPLMGGVRGG